MTIIPYFIRRLLGRECCRGGGFTKWIICTKTHKRYLTNRDVKPNDPNIKSVVLKLERWQERECAICGKIQQRKLRN